MKDFYMKYIISKDRNNEYHFHIVSSPRDLRRVRGLIFDMECYYIDGGNIEESQKNPVVKIQDYIQELRRSGGRYDRVELEKRFKIDVKSFKTI